MVTSPARTPRAARILCAAIAVLLLAAAYFAVRLAYADALAASDAPGGVERATRLVPSNAQYWLRLADLEEREGQSPGRAIGRAAEASPEDATVWIRAGLAAENGRDYTRAESCLLRAARLSRQYEPRWSLANYNFRRGNTEEFWRWTRSALEWAYGDRRPLFELAWERTSDAPAILRVIPENAPSLSAYLGFLLSSGRLAASPDVAAKLSRVCSKEYVEQLLYYTARMIEARQPEQALDLWTGLCTRRLLPYAPVDAARGHLLTNGDFAHPPLGTGFDWHVRETAGVTVVRSNSPSWIRFSFSGRQPEDWHMLSQLTPLLPATPYVLRFAYRTSGIAADSGLRWTIFDGTVDREIESRSPELASEQWKPESVRFQTDAATRWAWLVLGYRRKPGTTRVEGSLSLRDVSLEAGQ